MMGAPSSSTSQASSSALERGQSSSYSANHAPSPPLPPTPRFVTVSDLTDFRAMQRTFDLAYFRTALGELSFAVLVLKVFQPRFQVIGLLYTLLCLGHVGVAAWRRKLAVGNDHRWANLQIISHSTNNANHPALVTQELAADVGANQPLVEVSTEELNEAIAQDKITIIARPREGDGGDRREDTEHNASQEVSINGIANSHRQEQGDSDPDPDPDPRGAKTLVRIFSSDFKTAGHVIAIITGFTVALQVAILFSLQHIGKVHQ